MPHQIYTNPSAQTYHPPPQPPNFSAQLVSTFHASLPSYGPTPLTSLSRLSKDLRTGPIFIKDESSRFSLPSFKILGASWAIHRAFAQILNLPASTSTQEVGAAAHEKGLWLVTCSEGNWGRAVARMARILGVKARVWVPGNCHPATAAMIAGEGAEVCRVEDGNYDDSIAMARKEAEEMEGAVLAMDTSWDGYEEIPGWVVEGYGTMLGEVDEQVRVLTDRKVSHVVVSVGVGSWAHAVVLHYKSKVPSAKVVTVEPDTAACLKTSLEAGEIVTIQTGDTIMAGMNCGTVSKIAWLLLKDGVDAAVTITDTESHKAVQCLRESGINAGPCGAAPLAALQKLVEAGTLGLGPNSVIVLFSTEGMREYPTP